MMRSRAFAILIILVLATAAPVWALQIDVVVTVDNAYGFGFGDANSITTYFGGIRNVLAGEIFNGPPGLVVGQPLFPYTIPNVGPERYQLSAVTLADYVYIVAWSDDAAFQGVMAGFQLPNGPLLSGTGWEVFATGLDRDSNVAGDTLLDVAADLLLINAQIAVANANGGLAATTSVGWVDENGLLPNATLGAGELAIGPLNTANALFVAHSAIQGVSGQSRWMWYNEDPTNIANPFQFGLEGPDGHKEFLIFRIRVGNVIPEPTSLTLLAFGLGAAAWRRKRRRAA